MSSLTNDVFVCIIVHQHHHRIMLSRYNVWTISGEDDMFSHITTIHEHDGQTDRQTELPHQAPHFVIGCVLV